MESILCSIGNRELYMPVNEKVGNLMLKTQKAVNYSKRIAKMRHSYYGEIHDEYIVFSPTFLYAFEDTLEENGYEGAVHYLFNEYDIEARKTFYMLLREGKSFRFLEQVLHKDREETEALLRSLFEKLSEKIY